MKMKIVFIVLLVLLVVAEMNSCNPKGSLAAELNWANHGTCGE